MSSLPVIENLDVVESGVHDIRPLYSHSPPPLQNVFGDCGAVAALLALAGALVLTARQPVPAQRGSASGLSGRPQTMKVMDGATPATDFEFVGVFQALLQP